MKKIIIKGIAITAALAMTGCSDSFLEEKKNYDNVNTDIYNYYSGCNGRVNDIYSWCLPAYSDQSWQYPSMGNADICSKSTEEYAGFSNFVNPDIELTSTGSGTSVPDYFMNQSNNIQASVYGRIRNINDCIAGIEGGSLSQEEKNEFLGQVYFFRAWCYYNLVKWYGGVPLVKEVLEPVEGNYTARSSAKECIEFMCSDLDKAAKLLAAKTMDGGWGGSDWGKITTGTCLALKGRILLMWCSPLFNRSNDQQRWTDAYKTMKAELDSINACGYGLYFTGDGINGSDFAAMFSQSGINTEAVFVTLFNNIVGSGLDTQKNNYWESKIRPSNTGGSGKTPSEMMVNLFPMSDGKLPENADTYGSYTLLERSDSAYDENYAFVNRDPRFYRTFAVPGFRWAYNGDASEKLSYYPSDGKNYELWNYVWYTSTNDAGNVESSAHYGADGLYNSTCGVYVRKKSDDLDVNSSPLYQYEPTSTYGAAPFFSAAQQIELRYAEVLLNLAEVACGAGDLDYAVECLQYIRLRAGYTADNNYGLQSNLNSNQAACMSAILYERMIEFAYEGKRFDDCRRWMLYDGGATLPSGAPDTWKLTGWGGNTCTWLGVKPLNGQRRETMLWRTADEFGVGTDTYDGDPLKNETRCAAVDLRKELKPQLDSLVNWYSKHLTLKINKGDAYDSQKNEEYMNFRPKYYFLGLSYGAMQSNKDIQQTIGWEDPTRSGAMGTFDPLN